MRYLLVCTLTFLLLSTGYALQSKQGKLELKKEQQVKSHLAKALTAMIQLQAKVKTEGGEQKLFDALDLLKENINTKITDENNQFAVDGEQYDRDVARVQGTLNEIQGEIEVLQGSLIDLEREHASFQDDLASQQSQLAVAVNGVSQENQFLASQDAQYATDFQDYQNAIDLLGAAIDKLQEATVSQNDAWVSFLQTNTETLSGMSSNLHQSLRKVKRAAFYKPVLAMFAQLTNSADAPDHALIQKAQAALAQLRNYYTQGQSALTESYQATVEEHTTLLQTLTNQVSRLENTVIPGTQSNLAANVDTVNAKTNALDVATGEFEQYTANLIVLHDAWAQRQEMHANLVPEYEDELQIIFEAESLIGQAYARNV